MSTKSIISKDIRIINKQARGGIEKKKPFTTIMASKPQGISSLVYTVQSQKPSHNSYQTDKSMKIHVH